MNTKESQDLQLDLNRQLEDDDANKKTNDDQNNLYEQGGSVERGSSETRQDETDESTNRSSNRNGKKLRSRPQAIKHKSQPKRRKTIERENSDLTGKESVEEDRRTDEPIPGPSTSKVLLGPKKGTADFGLERMEADTSEDDDSSNVLSNSVAIGQSNLQSEDGIFDEAIEQLAKATKQYKRGMQEDISVVGNKRPGLESIGQHPTTSTKIHHRSATPPPVGSATFEEIFRMPIIERENRNSTYETNSGCQDESVSPVDPQRQRWVQENTMREDSENITTSNVPESEPKNVSVTAQDKQRIMWARKLFFMSSEFVFPGFTRGVGSGFNRNGFYAVRVRSSWVLQAILYADLLFFLLWILAFLSTFDITIGVLKELHGNLVLSMTALFTLVNIPRLTLGLKGNENDKLEMLALFWMMTFIVQAPLFGFIIFTDIFTPTRLAFTISMDLVMMIFIIMEVIVGTLHLKHLVQDELRVIELARKSDNSVETPGSNLHPRVVNTTRGPVINWISDPSRNNTDSVRKESEDDLSTDESEGDYSKRERNGEVEYEMRILPLSQEEFENEDDEPERDDSNQVSSTSDSIRQRQIRVL